DAIEGFLDVLYRVGHAEAQIAFTEIAECGPRQGGYAGIVEQRVGQFFRRPAGPLDVGENVERALGQATGKTSYIIEAGDHHVAPLLELGAHRFDRLLRSTQRLDAGNLGKAGGARVGVRHQTGDVRCQVGAHYTVTHTPASHGVSLGKTVKQ